MKAKRRKCFICKASREVHAMRVDGLKAVCNDESQDCVAKLALWKLGKIRKEEAKEFKRETRKRREETKARTELYRDLQVHVNRYVLLRDRGKPCITCGTTSDIKYDAGHYRSVGSCKELRFELTNIHKQCSVQCNMYGSGMRKEYRDALILKYGDGHTAWLDGPHERLKLKFPTHDDIRAAMERYKLINKRLKRKLE